MGIVKLLLFKLILIPTLTKPHTPRIITDFTTCSLPTQPVFHFLSLLFMYPDFSYHSGAFIKTQRHKIFLILMQIYVFLKQLNCY
jgi:hypothetical protein